MKKILYFLSTRSAFIVTILLLAVMVLLVWFIVAGFTPALSQISLALVVLSTIFAAISSIANLLQAVETQKQSEMNERPYIVGYFDSNSSGYVFFVIENSGNAPAVNVHFKFDPSPLDARGKPLNEISLFQNTITFFSPGMKYRQLIDLGARFLAEGKPTVFNLDIRYESVFGKGFHESLHHDITYLKETTLPAKSIEDYLKLITEQLGKIALK